jgi:hypothetical protein
LKSNMSQDATCDGSPSASTYPDIQPDCQSLLSFLP